MHRPRYDALHHLYFNSITIIDDLYIYCRFLILNLSQGSMRTQHHL